MCKRRAEAFARQKKTGVCRSAPGRSAIICVCLSPFKYVSCRLSALLSVRSGLLWLSALPAVQGALPVARVRSPSHGCAPRRTGALPVARMLRRIPVGILLRHPSPGVALRRRAECARPRKAKSILLTSPRYQAVSAYKENSPAPRFLGAGGEKDTVDVRLFQTKRNVSRSGIVHWRRPNEGRAPPAELRPPAAKGLRPLDSHDAHAGLCGRGAERRAAVPDSASPPLSG